MPTTTNLNIPTLHRARRATGIFKHRIGAAFSRAGLAWRFLTGQWSDEDAKRLRWAAQQREGWYPLEGFGYRAVLKELEENYDMPANSEEFARSGTARTAEKWCSDGEIGAGAVEDAVRRAQDYARDAGTPFIDP